MVATHSTTVLHPAAEDTPTNLELAPRLPELRGATVVLIDNHKKNADVYLDELGRMLREEYGVTKLVNYRKISQSIPIPADVMDGLAAQCDAMVHAVAD